MRAWTFTWTVSERIEVLGVGLKAFVPRERFPVD
jgi:hypothetical protein